VGRSNRHFDAPKIFGMSTTLPLYWNLSSHTKEERIGASAKLIRALQCFQRDFQPPPDFKFNAKTSIDASNTQDASYALKRLARGLGSPRESSRLGFAVALTEVNFDRRAAR
jgi:DNA polymerase phi